MRAAAYIRVSDPSQVEGHSLDAQERLFRKLCRTRGWEPMRVYREEGKSAHVDSIRRRPVFQQMLDDASRHAFDTVVVHTLDRFARNLRVMLEAMSLLAGHGVGLVSITESIDYSSPAGKMATQMLGRLAKAYVDRLVEEADYDIQQRVLKSHLEGLVVPEERATLQAGHLLENLPTLWGKANPEERHSILKGFLEALYVDLGDPPTVVGVKPRPQFAAVFRLVGAHPGSGVVIQNTGSDEGDSPEPTMTGWWRRGRVELPVQKSFREDVLQA